jgi:cation diffusion facilitator family transporter
MTSNKGTDKTRYIRAAAVIALAGNSALAAIKICAGIVSGSEALTADGIDSSADVLISLITLFVVGIISKPADREHPWGHGRAETVATAILSFILFFAGAQLILGSVARMFSGVPQTVPSAEAMGAAIVSIVGKVLLAYSQYVFGKRADSAMIKANAKNMAGDALISLGVLAGLAISSVTGSGVADTAIASIIGACVIKTAINVFMEANLELMDGSAGTEQYRLVFEAVRSVEGAGNPHRTRMRRIAGFWDIDIDIEVNPNITVDNAHAIACGVEREIKARLENVYDIVVHIEPSGDSVEGESFGLSEKGMRE